MGAVLITHGTLVTAADVFTADVLIEGERIAWIGVGPEANGLEVETVIDATGKYIFPGGVDVHTHLDMPLGEDLRSVDDFETGTIAAACGGTTTIIDYAAHSHGESLEQGLANWHRKAAGKAAIDYSFHLTLSEFTDQTLSGMERAVEQGASSFKVFTAYPGRMMLDDAALLKVLKKAKELGALVCVHAENGHLIQVLVEEALRAGQIAPKYHALTRPAIGEGEATHRVITLAEIAEAPLYVVHISCHEAIQEVAAAKQRGLPVYGETCPQYLLLSAGCYDLPEFEGAKYVMSPPLREHPHQESLWRALHTGAVDVIGTDHCPFHFRGQKEIGRQDFTRIPNGAPGIETRMSLLYTEGVLTGRLTLNRFVELTAAGPAKIFGLYPQKGTLAPGSDADLAIVDPAQETIISAITHHSQVDYSLYEGRRVKGMPEYVFLRGKLIVRDGKFVGAVGGGRFIKRPLEDYGRRS